MRKLLASAVLGLSMLSAPAHAVPDWIIPSPITIALQVGKWMMVENSDEEVYYIRVQSQGNTETEAREEAFRLAVDQALGSLLVSETEIQDDTVQSHTIINYSSGYIHDFEYVNVNRDSTGVVLHVDVWVKKSKIAERISLENQTEGKLEGGRIAESFRSLNLKSQTGDKLLDIVLDDYPHKSYDVNIVEIEYAYDNRRPILIIDFVTAWKNNYIISLQEVLQNIGVEKTRYDNEFSIRVDYSNCFFCKKPKYLLDNYQSNHVFMQFHNYQPMVNVQLLAIDKKVIHQGCVYFSNLHGGVYKNSLWEANGVSVDIFADKIIKNTIRYDLSHLNVNKLDTVNISIVRSNFCIDKKLQ